MYLYVDYAQNCLYPTLSIALMFYCTSQPFSNTVLTNMATSIKCCPWTLQAKVMQCLYHRYVTAKCCIINRRADEHQGIMDVYDVYFFFFYKFFCFSIGSEIKDYRKWQQ